MRLDRLDAVVDAGQRDGETRAPPRAQQHPELMLGVDGVHRRHDRAEFPDAELRDHPLRACRQHDATRSPACMPSDARATAAASLSSSRVRQDRRRPFKIRAVASGRRPHVAGDGRGACPPEVRGSGERRGRMGEPGARVHGGTVSGRGRRASRVVGDFDSLCSCGDCALASLGVGRVGHGSSPRRGTRAAPS